MTTIATTTAKTKGASKAKAIAVIAKNAGSWIFSTEKNETSGLWETAVVNDEPVAEKAE